MNVDKYLLEKRITSKESDLLPLIQNPKSAKYEIDGSSVTLLYDGHSLIFEYPSKDAMLTYNLVQVADKLNKHYTQAGLASSKNMHFTIKL